MDVFYGVLLTILIVVIFSVAIKDIFFQNICDKCYLDMECEGRASFGCCQGQVYWQENVVYLKDLCVNCPYCIDTETSEN